MIDDQSVAALLSVLMSGSSSLHAYPFQAFWKILYTMCTECTTLNIHRQIGLRLHYIYQQSDNSHLAAGIL